MPPLTPSLPLSCPFPAQGTGQAPGKGSGFPPADLQCQAHAHVSRVREVHTAQPVPGAELSFNAGRVWEGVTIIKCHFSQFNLFVMKDPRGSLYLPYEFFMSRHSFSRYNRTKNLNIFNKNTKNTLHSALEPPLQLPSPSPTSSLPYPLHQTLPLCIKPSSGHCSLASASPTAPKLY